MKRIKIEFIVYVVDEFVSDCSILRSYSQFESWLYESLSFIQYHINNCRSIWFEVYSDNVLIDKIYILKGGNLC